MSAFTHCATVPLLLLAAVVRADDDQIEPLIDQLVNVAEPGFGYSVSYSGSEFLPYESTGHMDTLVLGASRATRSETLRKIVENGADAVPALLKHIDDKRHIKLKPVSGMMWLHFSDEYDFNRRTAEHAPQGVNRHDFPGGAGGHPDSHAVTVGDLCFVTLGQIVNRRFSATRYQPTGGLIVSSPTYSSTLKQVILDDWSGLTKERHKSLLIDDFVTPDHASRRAGAYLRLAFYYPDAVEQLVLEELSKPTFDVMAIQDLCRNTLYKTKDKAERRRKYDEFLRTHGEVSAAGVLDYLFGDLARLQAHERRAISPPLTEFSTQPRELLIQLFGKPANVKSADRPIVAVASESERARLIRVLTHDESHQIGEVVKKLFLQKTDDAYFADACLRCLASRGYAEFLIEKLGRIDLASTDVKPLHEKYLEAISTSREPAVRDKLIDVVRTTRNDAYFMAALPAVDRKHDDVVLQSARRILTGLSKDTDRGERLLEMVGERFPDEAEGIYKSFVAVDSANRRETMCRVLWYGNPMSKEILAPFLDDKRRLPGFSIPVRVCDRAAQAISHTSKSVPFNEEWSMARKDQQIVKIKQYCKDDAK